MATEQRKKVYDLVSDYVGEKLALVRWHRMNACTKHGVQFEDLKPLRIEIDHTGQPPEEKKPEPTADPAKIAAAVAMAIGPKTPITPMVAEKAGGLLSRVPGWLKGSVLLAGSYAAYQYYTQPDAAPEPVQQAQPYDPGGSLLQHLEDHGFHLPPAEADDGDQ